MKRVLNIVVLFVCLVCFVGCKCKEDEYDFAYFKKNVNVIDNYKYYIVRETIYNEELLLYKRDKYVYIDGEKYRILLNTKEINKLDSDDLYKQNEEEFYQNGTDFYYKENNEWKIKQGQVQSSLGLSITKDIFSSYEITKGNSGRILKGSLKNNSLSNFFGFDLNTTKDVSLSIEISSKNKIKKISLEYTSNEGNKVTVSIDVGYSQIIKFELPFVS